MKAPIVFAAAVLSLNASAAPVYERICSILEDENTKTLYLRTMDQQFKAVFELNATDTKAAEVQSLVTEFSPDYRVETYKGRLPGSTFGPTNAKVVIHLDSNQRLPTGKTPATITFKRFIFGVKRYNAECSDWNPVASSRW